MTARGHCILSHGFESGPEATKGRWKGKVAPGAG